MKYGKLLFEKINFIRIIISTCSKFLKLLFTTSVRGIRVENIKKNELQKAQLKKHKQFT